MVRSSTQKSYCGITRIACKASRRCGISMGLAMFRTPHLERMAAAPAWVTSSRGAGFASGEVHDLARFTEMSNQRAGFGYSQVSNLTGLHGCRTEQACRDRDMPEATMNLSESVHRILEHRESLGDMFYLVFLDRYPDVRRHFQGVDLKNQAVLLTMVLMVIERHHAASNPATETYLKYLGTKHCRRGILPDLYPHFRDAMLAALEQFHSQDWTESLANQWTEAIEEAAGTMLEGYKQHYSV